MALLVLQVVVNEVCRMGIDRWAGPGWPGRRRDGRGIYQPSTPTMGGGWWGPVPPSTIEHSGAGTGWCHGPYYCSFSPLTLQCSHPWKHYMGMAAHPWNHCLYTASPLSLQAQHLGIKCRILHNKGSTEVDGGTHCLLTVGS